MFRSLASLIFGSNDKEKERELLSIPDCEFRPSKGKDPQLDATLSLVVREDGRKPSLKVSNSQSELFSFPIEGAFRLEDSAIYFESGEELRLPRDFTQLSRETLLLALAGCLFRVETGKDPAAAGEKEILPFKRRFLSVGEGLPSAKPAVPTGVEVFSAAVQFFEFSVDSQTFQLLEAKATISVQKVAPFAFSIHITSPDGRLHSQPVSDDWAEHSDRSTLSFVWCDAPSAFAVKFLSLSELNQFSAVFGQSLYEVRNQISYAKVASAEQQFLKQRYEAMEIDEIPQPASSFSDSDEEDLFFPSKSTDPSQEAGDQNQSLVVGYKDDLSFVSRGSTLGVFASDSTHSLRHRVTIKGLKTASGASLVPDQMLLHRQDSSLLFTTADQKNFVYRVDLERGVVAEEWKVLDDAAVRSIVPTAKYSQRTPEETLIGVSDRSVFRIDPRLSGSKRVDSERKEYATKTDFTGGATTQSGELAVASAKGELRLYDRLDKRAKTLIPGFGDPVRSVDVTDRGDFLLATCTTYLLLYRTAAEEGRTAFTKTLPLDQRTPPIKLQLRPEHIAFMGGSAALSFTAGHFSPEEGSTGSVAIISSTGQYLVRWSLDSVLAGKIYDYQLRKYADDIVAGNFCSSRSEDLVVALPHHVTLTEARQLAKPTARLFGSS